MSHPLLDGFPGLHIVLVGLMGSGKTSVGRMLSNRLGLPFVDTDEEIEKAAGCPIVEIFHLYGEAAFREGERHVIDRLLNTEPSVVSTGGGTFIDPENRDKIRQRGFSIWLRSDIDELYRRTRRRKGRPLLNNRDPRATLVRLAHERYPVYAMADITVDSGREKPSKTTERIISRLEAVAVKRWHGST